MGEGLLGMFLAAAKPHLYEAVGSENESTILRRVEDSNMRVVFPKFPEDGKPL